MWVLAVSRTAVMAAGAASLIVAFAGLAVGAQQRGSSGQVQRSRSLEGAWELVEVRHTPPDTFNLADWRQIKILTPTHWVFLTQKRASPNRTTSQPQPKDNELLAAAKAFGAGGGTYTLNGDTYTEHIEFFYTPNYVGATIPWTIRWDGDDWIMTGTFPMKSLGLADHDAQLYERYRRVK